MIVNDLLPALDSIAPLHLAADWDNVGLLLGSPEWPADRILLTIDLTQSVLEEAIQAEVKLIIAYHPPIFDPLKSITTLAPKSRIAVEALHAGISVYSPHTALDAAPGGINDWLAEGMGTGDVRALHAHEALPESQQCKIVTFAPAEAVDSIRNGLASVGAGRIGAYRLCSFEISGTGTFLGEAGTNPAVGKSGTLERVPEIRLEMVCSNASLALAIATLRQFHPYEEPPIEVYALRAHPQRGTGEGRRIVLDQPAGLKAIIERIKSRLNVEQLQVAIGDSAPTAYESIGLCAGSGGSLAASAIAQGCRMFLTGEMRHHDVLAAQAAGCTVVLAGHTNTERGYLKVFRSRLARHISRKSILISRKDSDPLRVM